MKSYEFLFVLTTVFCVGLWIGSSIGHHEISTECERLGGFYYGDKIYKCEVKR